MLFTCHANSARFAAAQASRVSQISKLPNQSQQNVVANESPSTVFTCYSNSHPHLQGQLHRHQGHGGLHQAGGAKVPAGHTPVRRQRDHRRRPRPRGKVSVQN